VTCLGPSPVAGGSDAGELELVPGPDGFLSTWLVLASRHGPRDGAPRPFRSALLP